MDLNFTILEEYSNWSSLVALREPTAVASVVTGHAASATAVVAYEWRYILPLYLVIFLLSVVGNSLVIATLAQNSRMRTVTNVYLLNLAVSDLLLGVFCLPFTLVGQVFRRFMFGSAMCKLIPYLQAVSVSVSVWTLVAISLERYCAICRPLKSRRWQTQGHAYKMIALVWLASLLLDSPILYVSRLLAMREDAFKCREIWTSPALERAFNLGLDLALLVIPFAVMSFAYSLIVAKLWRGLRQEIQQSYKFQKEFERTQSCRSNKHLLLTNTTSVEVDQHIEHWLPKDVLKASKASMLTNGACMCCREITLDVKPNRHVIRSTHTDKSIEAKKKVIRMLSVIILEFFICWTPIHAVNTVYLFYPEKLYNYIGPKGIALLHLTAYCSSCCNPITYCFMNRKFRQAFLGLFNCCSSKRGSCAGNGAGASYLTKRDAPSNEQNEFTACLAKGSQTGRSELVEHDSEDYV